jgi:hypothetical protein
MDKSRQRMIEVNAKDDAKRDNCFEAVNRAGVVKNHTITVYNPPRDAEEKAAYDRAWRKEKHKP